MCQLHFLHLLADHHQQHDSEQNAGSDQHFPIRQTLLKDKGQYCYHRGQDKSQQRAFQHHGAAQSQMIALQKKDDFKSFAIKRRESEQDQSEPQAPLGDLSRACIVE